jgi:hypothetical protein
VPKDMVTEIQVPQPSNKAKQVLVKFRLRNTVDFPIVSVASVITIGNGTCRDAKIALEAVAQRPIRPTEAERTIKGKAVNSSTAEAAAEVAIRREVERCEVEFHKIIGDITENPILIFLRDFVGNLLVETRKSLQPTKEFSEKVLYAHKRI